MHVHCWPDISLGSQSCCMRAAPMQHNCAQTNIRPTQPPSMGCQAASPTCDAPLKHRLLALPLRRRQRQLLELLLHLYCGPHVAGGSGDLHMRASELGESGAGLQHCGGRRVLAGAAGFRAAVAGEREGAVGSSRLAARRRSTYRLTTSEKGAGEVITLPRSPGWRSPPLLLPASRCCCACR